MAKVMSAEKNIVTRSKKKNKASTLPAKLEARSGNSGSSDCTVSARSLRFPVARVRFPAPENEYSRENHQHHQNPACTDQPQNHGAVSPRGGIGFATKQQQAIGRSAHLPGPCFHASHPPIPPRTFYNPKKT